jgi:predicted ribosomally synthesized peptide with nif11-like leader
MAVKDVKAFLEKVQTDKSLQAKLKALEAKAATDVEAARAELMRIAAEAGFEFTAADLAASRKARASGAKLSEAELKAAVGGAATQPPMCSYMPPTAVSRLF